MLQHHTRQFLLFIITTHIHNRLYVNISLKSHNQLPKEAGELFNAVYSLLKKCQTRLYNTDFIKTLVITNHLQLLSSGNMYCRIISLTQFGQNKKKVLFVLYVNFPLQYSYLLCLLPMCKSFLQRKLVLLVFIVLVKHHRNKSSRRI